MNIKSKIKYFNLDKIYLNLFSSIERWMININIEKYSNNEYYFSKTQVKYNLEKNKLYWRRWTEINREDFLLKILQSFSDWDINWFFYNSFHFNFWQIEKESIIINWANLNDIINWYYWKILPWDLKLYFTILSLEKYNDVKISDIIKKLKLSNSKDLRENIKERLNRLKKYKYESKSLISFKTTKLNNWTFLYTFELNNEIWFGNEYICPVDILFLEKWLSDRTNKFNFLIEVLFKVKRYKNLGFTFTQIKDRLNIKAKDNWQAKLKIKEFLETLKEYKIIKSYFITSYKSITIW